MFLYLCSAGCSYGTKPCHYCTAPKHIKYRMPFVLSLVSGASICVIYSYRMHLRSRSDRCVRHFQPAQPYVNTFASQNECKLVDAYVQLYCWLELSNWSLFTPWIIRCPGVIGLVCFVLRLSLCSRYLFHMCIRMAAVSNPQYIYTKKCILSGVTWTVG